MSAQAPSDVGHPPFRALRGYAFDPSLSTQLETAVVNEIVFRVRWEAALEAGPVGGYVEVVDYDPASACWYAPVDLNRPELLAQNGLPPSEGNPQFHQQMVYAAAMTTIRNFERALGRPALWSARETPPPQVAAEGARAPVPALPAPADAPAGDAAYGKVKEPSWRFEGPASDKQGCRRIEDDGWVTEYLPRLRIYPHAMRKDNAFYSPEKRALLFGYFPASTTDPGGHYPGGMVFTALSHDVVAHETTHALLDGMHRRFIEPTHPDALAFHEAFADIVALFQHFSFAEVLRHQIAKTRGDLASQNLLGELAQQFGKARGGYGALRDAIGRRRKDGSWEPAVPNPQDYQTVTEPHDRGAILVAAVFDAFISIYKTRVADLFRIATGGTGVLAPGALHPDLVNRLADEASKSAQHVLTMCVRALDYCPPVDVTFGDYLRALITADYDIVRDDDRGYRVAFIEAFRRRGIYPRDLRTLSEDTLRWKERHEEVECDLEPIVRVLRTFVERSAYLGGDAPAPEWWAKYRKPGCPEWTGLPERERIFWTMEHFKMLINRAVKARSFDRVNFAKLTGLRLSDPLPGLRCTGKVPRFEVHSVRPARRVSPDGDLRSEVVISITQRRKCLVEKEYEDRVSPAWYDSDNLRAPHDGTPNGIPVDGFWFRGGCTLILDLETQKLRYAVVKRIDSEHRMRRQQAYRSSGQMPGLRATYFGGIGDDREPFAFLHTSHEQEP